MITREEIQRLKGVCTRRIANPCKETLFAFSNEFDAWENLKILTHIENLDAALSVAVNSLKVCANRTEGVKNG